MTKASSGNTNSIRNTSKVTIALRDMRAEVMGEAELTGSVTLLNGQFTQLVKDMSSPTGCVTARLIGLRARAIDLNAKATGKPGSNNVGIKLESGSSKPPCDRAERSSGYLWA
jgi:hypothetical protein